VPSPLRPAVAVLTLSAFIGLAGCGGSHLSRSDYIAKVDPICAKYKAESQKLPEPTDPNDRNALAGYYDQLGALADKQTKEINDVGRPKEGKAQIDDLLKRQRAQIDRLRQLSAAVRANDEAKANQIGTDAQPAGKAIGDDFKAFGFKVCGGSS
jgi:hypothetical protein